MGVDFLQGRIVFLKDGDEALLREHLAALNRGCRMLFAGAVAQGETASKMARPAWSAAKMALEPFDGMTSDQKDSVWRRASDLRKTAKAGLKRESKELERRIAGLGKKIADEEKKARKEKSAKAAAASQAPTPFLKAAPTAKKKDKRSLPREAKIRALKERLVRLKGRLDECKAELDAGKASICFGGKALARKLSWADAEGKAAGRLAAELAEKIQASASPDPKLVAERAAAEAKGQDAKARGKALANEWRLRRNGGWTFEGKARSASRSESAKLDPETRVLRIRLTDALAEKRMAAEAEMLGISFQEVKSSPKFGYVRMACRFLELAVGFGQGKGQAERLGKLSKLLSLPMGDKAAVPVSWRISAELGAKGKLAWTAHAGWERASPEVATTKNAGALGVDLNAHSAAWAFVDPDGNSRSKARTKAEGKGPWFGTVDAAWGNGVSTDKTLSECRRLACELVEIASKRSCPIVMEALDFSRKKASLRYEAPEFAAMLSGFAYSAFRKAVVSRAEKKGVEVLWADPAWSSVSGFFKFANLGADPDEAAPTSRSSTR